MADRPRGASSPSTGSPSKGGTRTPQLDRLLHEPARLAIVSVLASRRQVAFTELRDLTELTDGNLSVHLRALEQAGHVDVTKEFVATEGSAGGSGRAGRRPRTSVRLSRKGRAAFETYLDALEAIVRRARGLAPGGGEDGDRR